MARMDETLPAVLFLLAFLVLFFFRRILSFIRRASELRKSEQKAPAVVSIVTFFGLARTNAPISRSRQFDGCEIEIIDGLSDWSSRTSVETAGTGTGNPGRSPW